MSTNSIFDRYDNWLADRDRLVPGAKYSRAKGIIDARAIDILTEAMGRLSAANRALTSAAVWWAEGPCPGLTCNEADCVHLALRHLGATDEVINGFMTSHAYTDDDPADTHMVDGSVDGCGWADRDPFVFELDDNAADDLIADAAVVPLFEIVGLRYYDPETGTLK
jgi:hypothetical protein